MNSAFHLMASQETIQDVSFGNLQTVFAKENFSKFICTTPHGKVCLSLKYIPDNVTGINPKWEKMGQELYAKQWMPFNSQKEESWVYTGTILTLSLYALYQQNTVSAVWLELSQSGKKCLFFFHRFVTGTTKKKEENIPPCGGCSEAA